MAILQRIDDRIHVKISSVLGQADEPGMDVRSVLFVYGIDVPFDDEVIEAEKVVLKVLIKTKRRDVWIIVISSSSPLMVKMLKT
ncbi:hypothetical protein MGH68_03035 [Erysipelothrix sp. D19-032]